MMNRTCLRFAIAGLMLVGLPSTAAAQAPSKSAAIAKELVQVMDAKKLDSIAAKTPTGEGISPPRCTSRTCSCSSSPAITRRRS